MFGRNRKISDIEKNIIRDLCSMLKTAYILPFKFSEPKKINGTKYRVSSDVVYAGGMVYPVKVFSGEVHVHERGLEKGALQSKVAIAVLNSEYESLSNWVGKRDDEIIFGVKLDEIPKEKDIRAVSLVANFDIDTKTGRYDVTDLKTAKTKNTIQLGEQ